VRFLERVSEDAVVTAFLRAELDSERFGSRLIELPDGTPPAEVFEREPEFRRAVTAGRIRRGLVPGADAESHEPVAAALRSPHPPPELIAVAPPERSPLVLVEGHVRLIAYALFPEYLPAELELFLGIADDARDWSEF